MTALQRFRQLLSVPERWTKGACARDKHGNSTLSLGDDAVAWCMLGAIRKAALPYEMEERLDTFIKRNTPFHRMEEFNDASTHAEVLKILDKFIAQEAA